MAFKFLPSALRSRKDKKKNQRAKSTKDLCNLDYDKDASFSSSSSLSKASRRSLDTSNNSSSSKRDNTNSDHNEDNKWYRWNMELSETGLVRIRAGAYGPWHMIPC